MSALTGGSKKSKVLEFKVPKEKKVDKASLEKVKKARAAASCREQPARFARRGTPAGTGPR